MLSIHHSFRAIGAIAITARRSIARGVLAAAVVALLGVLATPDTARAQFMPDMFAKPISTAELFEYFEPMKLSAQQKAAIETMHDRYKVQYKSFEENDVARFKEQQTDLQSGGMWGMPERRKMEAYLEDQERLTDRVSSIDRSLFNEIQGILTEEQSVHMSRVQLARERKRLTDEGVLMFAMSFQQFSDLNDIMKEAAISSSAAEQIDPIMDGYERRLTSLFRDLKKSQANLFMMGYDVIEQLGMTEADVSEEMFKDPEKAQKFMEVMQEAFRNAMAPSQAVAKEMRKLNSETYRSMVAQLEPGEGRKVTRAYATSTFPSAASITMVQPYRAEVLDQIEGVDPQKLAALQETFAQADTEIDQLISSTLAELEQHQGERGDFDMFGGGGGEDMQEFFRKQSELVQHASQKASEIDQRVQAVIAEALTPEQRQNYNAMRHGGAEAPEHVTGIGAAIAAAGADIVAAEGGEAAEIEAEGQDNGIAWTGDEFLPQPIRRGDLRRSLRLLGLADDQLSKLQELHQQYQKQITKISENEFKRVRDARMSMWQWGAVDMDGDGEIDEPDPNVKKTTPRELADLRRAAIAVLTQADDAFLNDVQQTFGVGAEQMESVRMFRQRQRVLGARNVWPFVGNDESTVDLIVVLDDLRLEPAARQAASAALVGYEQQFTNAAQQRYENMLEFSIVQEEWQQHAMEMQNDPENQAAATAEYFSEWQERLSEVQKKSHESGDHIAQMNRTMLQQLLDALPAEEARKLSDEYFRKAFPSVYMDGAAAGPSLEQSMSLTDLSQQQREQLEEIVTEYRPRYDELSRQMVELSGNTTRFSYSNDPEEWQKLQETQGKLQKLRYERSELNARALARLERVLRPEQIETIGSLPKVEAETEASWFGW